MAGQGSLGLQSAWLGLVEATFFNGNGYDASRINDGRAMRRCLDEEPTAKDEDCSSDNDDPMVVNGFNMVTNTPAKLTPKESNTRPKTPHEPPHSR